MTPRIHVDSQNSRSITDPEARECPSLWGSRSLLEPARDRMGLMGLQLAERGKRNLLTVTELDARSASAGFHPALGKWPYAREVHSGWWSNQYSGSSSDFPDWSIFLQWDC